VTGWRDRRADVYKGKKMILLDLISKRRNVRQRLALAEVSSFNAWRGS